MRRHLEAQIANVIPWWSTDFGEPEIERVSDAIRNRHISQGPVTRQFEERLGEILGVPYVVCTTSGTTALTMALLACGIGQGDEVIVPNRTWIATAHAVMFTGADVVLADVSEKGPWLDFFTEPRRLKAVVPVNLNGRMVPYHPETASYFKRRGVSVIEDSCQAFPNPPRGDIACYSLSTAKLIATGQGGFCATRDEGLFRELKALRTHDVEDAMVPQVLEWKRFGYNFRFTDIQAAIGVAQLERLPARLDAIHSIHAEYKSNGVPVLETPTPLYNELLHVEPERLRKYLAANNIEARPIYPSLHTAPYLHATGEFPNSEKFSRGLFLPSGPCQKLEDIKRVCEVLNAYKAG